MNLQYEKAAVAAQNDARLENGESQELSPEQIAEVGRAYRVGMLMDCILGMIDCVDVPDSEVLDALVGALTNWYMENNYNGEASEVEFLKEHVSSEAYAIANEMDIEFLEENGCCVPGDEFVGCSCGGTKHEDLDRRDECCGNCDCHRDCSEPRKFTIPVMICIQKRD